MKKKKCLITIHSEYSNEEDNFLHTKVWESGPWLLYSVFDVN